MQNCTSYIRQGKAILGFPESQINCRPNRRSGLNLRRRKLDLRGFKVESWDFCDTSLGFSAFLLNLELAPTSEDLTLGYVELLQKKLTFKSYSNPCSFRKTTILGHNFKCIPQPFACVDDANFSFFMTEES